MSERKSLKSTDYNRKLQKIGVLLQQKRWNILNSSRKLFIEDRSLMLFSGEDWISERYLINIESGKNLPSIEMLIKLAIALETDPVELFENVYEILFDNSN